MCYSYLSTSSFSKWTQNEVELENELLVRKMKNHFLYHNESFALLYETYTSKNALSPRVQYYSNGTAYTFTHISQNFIILEEAYFFKIIPLHVAHQNIMFEPLQDFILKYREHGFDEYIDRAIWYIMESRNLVKKYFDSSDPKVLTLKMLEAGFIIWMALIPLACLVFLGELIMGYFSTIKEDETYLMREKVIDGEHVRVTQLCSIDQSVLFDT